MTDRQLIRLDASEWRVYLTMARAIRKGNMDLAKRLAERQLQIRTILEVPDSLMHGSIKDAVLKRSGLDRLPAWAWRTAP